MFTFTPLYGAQSASPATASLLELDGDVKILVDIGWDASFSTVALRELEKHVSTLSLVLLTHATLDHIGAYAHACKHIPEFIRIPVYATIPVANLGLTLLTDLYASSPLAASTIPPSILGNADDATTNFLLQPPTAEELSRYFNHITTLKYSQPHQPTPSQFSPSLGNLTITAYAAGHTVGGTIWHLQHGLESIVYAADWNQGRENLIGGAAWLSASSGGAEIIEPLRRPTALICSSRGVEVEKPLTRRKRDEALISLIRDTLTDGGNILIPTDSSARVLELAFLLNQTWRSNADGPHAGTYKNSKIFMASKSATSTQRFLQSMLEWMDDAVIREAEAAMTGKTKTQGSSPLDWEFVRLIERQSQLDRALRRNKSSVIIASDASLEWGYSRHALQKLASDPRNLIVLTELSSSSDAVSSQLWSAFHNGLTEQPEARIITPKDLTLKLSESTLHPLDGEEQAIYTQYIARQRAMTTTTSTLPANGATEDLGDADADAAVSESSDSDEDDNEEADAQQQGRALNLSAQLSSNKRKVGLTEEELGVDILLTAKVHDYEVQGKRGRERMYPMRTTRKRTDDFGEPINVTDYLRAEEKEELDNADEDSTKDRKVGEKRKWNDVAATSKLKIQKPGSTPNKKIKMQNDETDTIDAAIAKATGVNGSADSDSEESEYEPDEATDPIPGPKKITFTTSELPLSARLAYVDFTARHEKRDLLMLIPLIRPRKLILISGSASETQTLAEGSRAVLQSGSNGTSKASEIEVFTPLDGERVDASVDTNAWTLKLGRNLLRKLAWQGVRGLGIVALTGLLQAGQPKPVEEDVEDDDIAKKKRKLAGNVTAVPKIEAEEAELLPVLDIPGESTRAQALVPHAISNVNRPIHVGDLRLSDLRNLLRAAGHIADFRGEGTLLVDGVVVVRKGAGGRIDVEGGIYGIGGRGRTGESTFGEVRRKVYEGLAVVGGNVAAA
ncbi:hypothetical protein AMS68_001984 [Peltaster fructicola]|uniref:Cleavage and polyadenylation specificity factor subunit 2 n=1 Tax=Peltaster fructicola TaxID=286661 RepID=A0A6H0XNY0_9PEZI|nr:hypothetical protein AMS68_001984 [Peltaster fructicola]